MKKNFLNALQKEQQCEILYKMKQEESLTKFQNILLCLYELKKENIYFQYKSSNYYPNELKKICIKNAYEYISDKFHEFQMPQEAVEFYV